MVERRKLERVTKPQEAPAASSVPKPAPPVGRPPIRREPASTPKPQPITEDLNKRAGELRSNSWQLIQIWKRQDRGMKVVLHPSLISLSNQMRAVALECGGYGKGYGDSRAVLKAKWLYITGEAFDRVEHRCMATTKDRTRCKNIVLVGERFCHVPGHASDVERERAHENTGRWIEYFDSLLDDCGLLIAYKELGEVIKDTKELI